MFVAWWKKCKVTFTVKLNLWSVRHDVVYVVQELGKTWKWRMKISVQFVHIVTKQKDATQSEFASNSQWAERRTLNKYFQVVEDRFERQRGRAECCVGVKILKFYFHFYCVPSVIVPLWKEPGCGSGLNIYYVTNGPFDLRLYYYIYFRIGLRIKWDNILS